MSSKDEPQPAVCFEEALAELEAIVHELEEGQIGLAEALGRYETGVRLLKQCHGLLEDAQRRIELLTGIDSNGNPITQPLEESAASLEEKAETRSQRRSAAPPARRRPAGDLDESAGLF